jgi:hypothetical protein
MTTASRFDGFSRRRLLLGGTAAALAATAARAAAAAASPVLVELFTSQGCNSCPPADAYLTELARQPGVLALAYHIDYWDQLGWRDPFSSPAATARQRFYARALGLRSIYTPQIVVNGRHDAVGSDRRQVAAAISEAAATAPKTTVSLLADGGRLVVNAGAGSGEGRLWSVAYDLSHETHVRGGENAGRTLVNVNIVRALDDLAAWRGAALSVDRDPPQPGTGVAAFVQAADGAILGAAALAAPST